MRGIIPLDRFHLPARLARTVRSDRFTVTVNRDFDARARRLRRSRGRAARAPGSIRASARSTASCTSAAIATASKSTTATNSSAVSMASRSAARSSARACSTARATPRRSRWCIWWRGSRPAASSCCDTQFVTDHLKSFGAIEVPRRQYHKLLEAALTGEADFARARHQASGHRRARRSALLGAIGNARTSRDRAALADADGSCERMRRALRLAADWLRLAGAAAAGGWRGWPTASPASRLRRRGHGNRRALTVRQPDVVDRMLDPCRPGLAANIQPVKMRLTSPCSVTSSTSTKASVFGVSVGGRV